MPSKKMRTKKSVSKHTSSTAKASANSLPMNSNHSVEYCVGCRGKVKISNITQVEFKGKGTITRRRMVGTCEHGHKWGKFVASKSKTVGNSNNKKMVHTGGSDTPYGDTGYITAEQVRKNKGALLKQERLSPPPLPYDSNSNNANSTPSTFRVGSNLTSGSGQKTHGAFTRNPKRFN